MILVAIEDFTGEYAIADATGRYTTAKMQSYIDKYEPIYLRRLLGVSLAADLIMYLPARLPADADLNHVIDAFAYQDTAQACNMYLESSGMKDFLLACIMYEYVHNEIKNTQAGTTSNTASAAEIVTPRKSFRFAEHKYNKALNTAEAIQTFICINPANYAGFDKYAGQKLNVKYGDIL